MDGLSDFINKSKPVKRKILNLRLQEAEMKRKTYTGDFKARIVIDWLKGKKELKVLAEENNLNPNQIKNWKSKLFKHAGIVLEDGRRHK